MNPIIRPRRSVLYMPGSNARALEKAKSLDADAFIFDLEDAVAMEAKETARNQVCAAVKAGGYGQRELVIRINDLRTVWGRDDLMAAVEAVPDAILVPKVSDHSDLEEIEGMMNSLSASDAIQIWVMMETPLAMLNARDIAATAANPGGRLGCFIMGTNDLAKDTRAKLGGDRLAMLSWLSTCVAAGRAYGLDIIDGVYNDFRNEQGLRAEAEQGRDLGMDGKTLIHPGQIGPTNDVFSPSADEIVWAEKIIAAFDLMENKGKGVVTIDGKMVELLHAEMAKRTLAVADGKRPLVFPPSSPHISRISQDHKMAKTSPGHYFEDFFVGQDMHHATPRTVTSGDVALYIALYGSRFAVQSSEAFAHGIGYTHAPVDDMLVFHIVFGKTVSDISLNAVANLGYAECKFLAPVYCGDTLSSTSQVIGVRENSNGKTGVVYVRTTGVNQKGEHVLEYVRWVMVRKRDAASPAPEPVIPHLHKEVQAAALGDAVPMLDTANYDTSAAGSPDLWDHYEVGEQIDHVDGMTVEEAEHQMATRLYQNTAKVHFNQFAQSSDRFGRRLIYGGHVISLARALSFNGLANAFHIAAINGGRHVAPLFAGDTVFAWSQIIDKCELSGRHDVGALRIRTFATKDCPCAAFPGAIEGGYAEGVILDLDYWALMVREEST